MDILKLNVFKVFLIQNILVRAWRNCLMVKSTCHSYRGPVINPKHPHQAAYNLL